MTGAEVACANAASAAFVAVTVQLPRCRPVSVLPDSEHGPPRSEYVTAPVPEPPVVESVPVASTRTVVGEARSVRGDWGARPTVTVAGVEVAAANAASAAFVAVTEQLPAPVPVSVEPLTLQGPETSW